MDALETLSNEHGLIRQYLENLALAAQRIEEGRRPSLAFFEKAIDFARTFTDSYHHFKEEHVLFVRLAEEKKGEIDAQLDALRHQHERGRALITGIRDALEGYAARDPSKTTELLENLAAYGTLLRHHIHTEDHVFYPLVRRTLGASGLHRVEPEFEKAKQKHGADTFERYHKQVVDMGSIIAHLK